MLRAWNLLRKSSPRGLLFFLTFHEGSIYNGKFLMAESEQNHLILSDEDQPASERTRRWTKIVAFGIPILAAISAILAFHIIQINDPLNQVEFWRSNEQLLEENELFNDLKIAVIPDFHMRGEPFEKGVALIQDHLTKSGIEPVMMVCEEGVDPGEPITLRLTNVPAIEALRYLCALNRARYDLDSNRTIRIVSMNTPPKVVEGYFRVPPYSFTTTRESNPEDVTDQLAQIGVKFGDSEKALFFPRKDILWVKTTTDQMELIEAYLIDGCHIDLPWYYPIYEKVWLLLNPAPPASPVSPPSSPAASPDPFGGSGEPDPFAR